MMAIGGVRGWACAGLIGAALLAGCGAPRLQASHAAATPSPESSPDLPSPQLSPATGGSPSPPPPSRPTPTAHPASPPATATPCRPDQVALRLRTDKSTYTYQANVRFLITLTNTSSTTCAVDENGTWVTIYDSAGNAKPRHGPMGVGACCPPSPFAPGSRYYSVLLPGQAREDDDCAWQGYSNGPYGPYQLPQGTYHAIVRWYYPQVQSAPAYFNTTGGPSPSAP